MKIVVLVKQVPDSGADRNLRSDDNTVDRGSASNVINEMDEYAIEEALQIQEKHGGEVVVLTMGPDRASESIRKALSMGADKAIHDKPRTQLERPHGVARGGTDNAVNPQRGRCAQLVERGLQPGAVLLRRGGRRR